MELIALVVKCAVALVLSAFLLLVCMFVEGMAIGAWYRYHRNIAANIDLSEDYGLGMLIFFTVAATAPVAIPVALFMGWRLSGRVWRAVVAKLTRCSACGGR